MNKYSIKNTQKFQPDHKAHLEGERRHKKMDRIVKKILKQTNMAFSSIERQEDVKKSQN